MWVMSNNQWNGAQDWNAQPQQNNSQEWGAQPTQDWNAQQQPQQDWGQSSQEWTAQSSHQPASDDWTTVAAPQNQQSAPQASSPHSATNEWRADQSVPATEQTTWTGAPPAAGTENTGQIWGQQQDWNSQQGQQAPQQQWGQQAAYGAPQQQWGGQPAPAQPSLFSALFDFKFNQRLAKIAPGAAYMIILIVLAAEVIFKWIALFGPYAPATSIISGIFVGLTQFVVWAVVWRFVIEGVVALVKLADKSDQKSES